MWMKGPDFSKLPSDEWPQLKEPLPPPTEVYAKASFVCSNTDSSRQFDINPIIDKAPHFGGLWQAAVKAAKTLVEKNLTSAHQTLFLDVEAILNSQPIAPASDDPNDIAAVTPAHLLTGTSLTSAAEADLHHHSDQAGKEIKPEQKKHQELKQREEEREQQVAVNTNDKAKKD
ncbi:hypothetical protein ACLKA7_017703, partial [Drosophila subpalustris]